MLVTVKHVGLVTSIILNRPEASNSIDRALATALGDAVRAADDAGSRVIVISGTGKGFSSGLDLKAFARGDRGEHAVHTEWGFAGITRQSVVAPVIAAVHGFAVGGGAEIALAADLIVADDETIFAFPETGHGIIAGGGGLLRLPDLIPPRIAMEMLLTGRKFTAEEAHRWGLVNIVTDAGDALKVALQLAARIAERSPTAVQATKRVASRTIFCRDQDGGRWELNDAVLGEVLAGSDAAEGLAAFADKRAPRW